MLLKYDKKQFNYLYRICNYFIDETKDNEIKKMISDFLYRIEDSLGWIMEEGEFKVVLQLTDKDIAVLLYVYENIIFFTVEGQNIMNVCPDRFSVLKEKMYEQRSEKK